MGAPVTQTDPMEFTQPAFSEPFGDQVSLEEEFSASGCGGRSFAQVVAHMDDGEVSPVLLDGEVGQDEPSPPLPPPLSPPRVPRESQ